MFIRNIMWYHRKSINGPFSNGYVKHEARSPCFRSQAQAPGRSQVAVVVPPPTAGPCPGVLLLPPAAMRSDLVGESNGIYYGVYHDTVVDCLSMFLPSNHHYLRCFVVTNSCQRIIHLRCFILVSLLSTRKCPFAGIVSTCRAWLIR